MNHRIPTFSRRIPEPNTMERVEMDVFARFSQEQYERWIIPLVDDVIAAHAPAAGDAILDVACGPGLLSKEFARRFRRCTITGIDISPEALRHARASCAGMPNVRLVKGSIERLPFESGNFAIVVCKDSLHHFPSARRALTEMLRVLRPGGLLYVQDMRRDLPQYLLRRSVPPVSVMQKLQYYSTRASYTKRELSTLIARLPDVARWSIGTRLASRAVLRRYSAVEPRLLREGFQARYRAVIRKRRI